MKATAVLRRLRSDGVVAPQGETEYGVKAIPAGGFVKIVGMTPLEELDDPDDEQAGVLPVPGRARAIVLVAGSTMHFLLAIVLVFVALLISPIATSAPGHRRPRDLPVRRRDEGVHQRRSGAAPRKAAGLHGRRQLISVGGTSTPTFAELRDAIRADKSAAPLAVRVRARRQGLQHRPSPRSCRASRPTAAAPSRCRYSASRRSRPTSGSLDGRPQDHHDARHVHHAAPPARSPHFPQRVSTIFSNHRDPNGAVGVIGISRVSGDLLSGGGGIGGGVSWATRIGDFLLLVAG